MSFLRFRTNACMHAYIYRCMWYYVTTFELFKVWCARRRMQSDVDSESDLSANPNAFRLTPMFWRPSMPGLGSLGRKSPAQPPKVQVCKKCRPAKSSDKAEDLPFLAVFFKSPAFPIYFEILPFFPNFTVHSK